MPHGCSKLTLIHRSVLENVKLLMKFKKYIDALGLQDGVQYTQYFLEYCNFNFHASHDQTGPAWLF